LGEDNEERRKKDNNFEASKLRDFGTLRDVVLQAEIRSLPKDK
jgi:hypothetical protein